MNRIPLINLLPYRQLQQVRKNEQFRRALMLMLVLSLAILAVLYAYQKYRLNHQQAINDEIKARMATLDDDIVRIAALENEQKALLDKVRLINELGKNRQAMVVFFENMARMSAHTVYFSQISHAGDSLTITGVAKDSAAVSQFAKSVSDRDNPMLSDAMITSLQESPDGAVNFVMTATLKLDAKVESDTKNPPDDDAQEGDLP